MRILITTIHYYPQCPSGSAKIAFDEANYLSGSGHEVWIITQDISGGKPGYRFQDGIHILQYPVLKIPQFDPRRLWAHQLFARSLVAHNIKSKIDLVHGHSLLQYHGVISLYSEIVKKCYSVHSPVQMEIEACARGAPFFRRLKSKITACSTHAIEARCLKLSDYITAFSLYTKRMLRVLHGEAVGKRVQIIPGWVDLERFKIIKNRNEAKYQLGWPLDMPTLFTLRRLVPRMGLDGLLYALKEVKSSGETFYLVLGGVGPLRSNLEVLAEKLGIKDNVRFIGYVPDEILPLMYGAADVFVLPTSELECFGLIALEALASGRPVLATPVGAIPEIMGRFEKGWLANDSSIRSISRLIKDFLKGDLPFHSPEELREKVAKYYSKNIILEQLVSTAFGRKVNLYN